MSHVVVLEISVKDKAGIEKTCEKLSLPQPQEGTHRVYSKQIEGLGVQLPGWVYPVVIQENGKVKYDNYNGAWGKQVHLDKFVQTYAGEVTKKELTSQGFFVSECVKEDGSLRLVAERA